MPAHPPAPTAPSLDAVPAVAPQWFQDHHLKLRHLTVLIALCETGSVSAAAQRLHTTQPAVSRALGEIENAATMRLFERRARGISPTPAGEALVRTAREIFGVLQRSGRELNAVAAGMQGNLAIGCNYSAAAALVPQSVLALTRRAPRLAISVREGPRQLLLEDLRTHRLDVVVARLDPHAPDDGPDLQVRVLWDEPLCIVCAAGHPLTRQRRVPWKALGDYPWIMPLSNSPVRAGLDGLLRDHGVQLPFHRIESTSIRINQWMLREMDALTVMSLPEAGLYCAARMLSVLPLKLPLAFGKLGAMTLRERPAGEAVEAFMECLWQQRPARAATAVRRPAGRQVRRAG